MKVYFEVASADIQNAYVTIENQNFPLTQIACFGKLINKPFTITKKSLALTGVTMNLPVYFQGAGVTGGAASELYVLDNNTVVAMKNFTLTNITRFSAGKIYAIPYSIVPAVDIVPTENNILIQGVNTIFTASHWAYLSPTETNLLNQTNVADVLQVDIDAVGASINQSVSDNKKAIETAQIKQNLLA